MKKAASTFWNFAFLILLAPVLSLANVDLNPKDVRPWNKNDKVQFPTPLGAVFKKENQTLIFVGDHHSDPASTYNLVEAASNRFFPEIVIVEGLDFSLGENPKTHLAKYTSKSKEEVWKDPSLGSGTELLALGRKIPVIGGEPTIEEQMHSSFILEKGFGAEDILNVQILQRIPYRRDQLRITDPDRFFDYARELYRVTEPRGLFKSKFLQWYKNRTLKDFDYSKITKDESAVNCSSSDTFLQKVACATNTNRDRYLVERIGLMFKKYQRVLVVYGTGHYVQEYPVFIAAFPQGPEYFKAGLTPICRSPFFE